MSPVTVAATSSQLYAEAAEWRLLSWFVRSASDLGPGQSAV